jgi:16S rRNA (adenine1518-N6/adenine1519-N6)-dimethyltransferase
VSAGPRPAGPGPGRAQPRRSLGQHFLTDRRVAGRIVAAAEVGGRPPVLEIGPGTGALTGFLRAATDRLYLVEIDARLAGELRVRYGSDPGVTVVEADVLAVDLDALVAEPAVHVVGNLPYNIASQVLLRLMALRGRCPLAVVMLQDEVARRVAAAPGGSDYGVLSLLVQLYAQVERCFGVSRRCFYPPPKVDSTVVRLRLQAAPRVPVADPDAFRLLVRAVFQHRRQMLRRTLGAGLAAIGGQATSAGAVLRAAAIDPAARPERLSLADFARLTAAAVAQRSADA